MHASWNRACFCAVFGGACVPNTKRWPHPRTRKLLNRPKSRVVARSLDLALASFRLEFSLYHGRRCSIWDFCGHSARSGSGASAKRAWNHACASRNSIHRASQYANEPDFIGPAYLKFRSKRTADPECMPHGAMVYFKIFSLLK